MKGESMKRKQGPKMDGAPFIVHALDESPDTSYLGEYSNGDKPGAIDRQEKGDMGRGEYRYFHSANHSVHNPADWTHVSAKDKQKVIREYGSLENATKAYADYDYGRMERLNRGDWCYMGVYAVAHVIINGTAQRFRSPGLWGIESDSDKSYFAETAQGELDSLRGILKAAGVRAPRRFLVADCETKERD